MKKYSCSNCNEEMQYLSRDRESLSECENLSFVNTLYHISSPFSIGYHFFYCKKEEFMV